MYIITVAGIEIIDLDFGFWIQWQQMMLLKDTELLWCSIRSRLLPDTSGIYFFVCKHKCLAIIQKKASLGRASSLTEALEILFIASVRLAPWGSLPCFFITINSRCKWGHISLHRQRFFEGLIVLYFVILFYFIHSHEGQAISFHYDCLSISSVYLKRDRLHHIHHSTYKRAL